MKKSKLLLLIMAVALLAGLCLTACNQEPAETEPPVMDAYWNLDGAEYNDNGVSSREAKGGVYTISTVYKGKLTKLKVEDKTLVDKIDSMQIFGVEKNDKNVVTAVKTVEDMGGKVVYEGYAFEVGDAFQMNAVATDGTSVNIKTPSRSCFVTDLVSDPEDPVRIYPDELVRGDYIVAVEDYQGNITNVYFYKAGLIRSGKDQFCPHCCEEGETVHFDALMQGIKPGLEGGHYFLYEDREQADQQGVSKGVELVIDLNGFKIFCENPTKRILTTYGGDETSYFGIMDTSEAKTGTILNDHNPQDQNGSGAAVWITSNGTFEIFSGTIDASNCVSYGVGAAIEIRNGATFIMHEGATLLGGTTVNYYNAETDKYTNGGNGGAIYCNGKFIMHGGKIVGGEAVGNGTDKGRGGCLYFSSGAVVEIHGGEIIGGYADNADYGAAEGLMYKHRDAKVFIDSDVVMTEAPPKTETPAPETPAPEGGTETPAPGETPAP